MASSSSSSSSPPSSSPSPSAAPASSFSPSSIGTTPLDSILSNSISTSPLLSSSSSSTSPSFPSSSAPPSADPDQLEIWKQEQIELSKKLILTDEKLGFQWNSNSNTEKATASALAAASSTSASASAVGDENGTRSSSCISSLPPLSLVGGVDISFVGLDNSLACAALVVLKYPSGKLLYEHYEMFHLTTAYAPGFLAFLVFVDGNGLLHPRGFGLACHLGVIADVVTIGIGKKLMEVDGLNRERIEKECETKLKKGGDVVPLIGQSGRTFGNVLRSSDGSKNPIFVSQGHRISLPTATSIVHSLCQHRIPEPIRRADLGSRDFIRSFIKDNTRTSLIRIHP